MAFLKRIQDQAGKPFDCNAHFPAFVRALIGLLENVPYIAFDNLGTLSHNSITAGERQTTQ